MNVAVTKKFSNDFLKVEDNIKEKTKNILHKVLNSNFNEIISNKSFRFHSLYNSKFKSFSINMNFRLLAILDGDTLIFHRLLNHDSAYKKSTLKNYNLGFLEDFFDSNLFNTPKVVEVNAVDTYFKNKINNLLLSIKNTRSLNKYISDLKNIENEDEFLNFIDKLNNRDAIYILEVYSFNSIDISNVSYKLLSINFNFEDILNDDNWNLYLHPTQKYITELNVKDKIFIGGAAGTGKTICCIKRAENLLNLGYKVAILVSTKSLKNNIEITILNTTYKDALFIFTPSKVDEIINLTNSYDHIIIDECQEFSPYWFNNIIKECKISGTGLSVFYDFNQMGSNIKPGDTSRYNKKFKAWNTLFSFNKDIRHIKLNINYRNPIEINDYCIKKLNSSLPYPININKSCYSTNDIVEFNSSSEEEIIVYLNDLVHKLLDSYDEKDIMIIDDIKLISSANDFISFNFNTNKIINYTDIALVKPMNARGYERKIVIFLTESFDENLKVGKSIKKYISLSRAKEQLFIIYKPK